MKQSRILMVVLGLSLAWIPESSGSQRVVIDKSSQVLRAYEGNQLVFQSRVSTGKPGKRTPSGTYSVRGKERMRYSRRYHNAPMPYSVHLGGHYYIHGFSSVPSYPASRGCIRLPIGSAREFYAWVDPGATVRIRGSH